MWHEFCDWYIEFVKPDLADAEGEAPSPRGETARSVLLEVLDDVLRLLHPFMPFITEELWQRLPHKGEALMISPWPERRGGGALPIDYEALALIWNH